MSFALGPFFICLFLVMRLRKLAKLNDTPDLERQFKQLIFVPIILLAVQAFFQKVYLINFLWDALMGAMILYAFTLARLRIPRLLLWAFIPYAILSTASHIVESTHLENLKKWNDYLENAAGLAFMWMLAILFTQSRQQKNLEKEKIKREQEDAINRAIAIRKVELEGEVAERTGELIRQKDELQLTLTNLQSAQKQLVQSEKMASLGELTAGIAHEIQNPLNFVNNFSEVSTELLKEMVDEVDKGNTAEVKAIARDLVQNLEKINHHGKRADAIVKSMLQHSRSSSAQKEPTNINALADEYLRLAYHGLRAKDKTFNATLKTDYDGSIGEVNIIPQDIGRVILNLLNNAFYAAALPSFSEGMAPSYKQEPTVWLTTKKSGNKVLISVRDNGPGISSKILDKIFQPFFTTKSTGQGTGLGLSLSYDIIKVHGGELKVETKESSAADPAGGGTTFIISIPIAKQ